MNIRTRNLENKSNFFLFTKVLDFFPMKSNLSYVSPNGPSVFHTFPVPESAVTSQAVLLIS